MADDAGAVTEQVFEPSPERAQTPFGEHFPWIFTFFGEDVLEVTSWNSAAGVRLRISGRVHAAPGVIVPFSATHVPNTDRSAAMTVITMPLGELLNAIVWAETGSPQAGQTFVRIAVRRGAGAAFERLGVIIQGSITSMTARAFPGSAIVASTDGSGFVRSVSGTQPAAGLEIAETVPARARWQVIAFRASLITSAVVASRGPSIQFDAPAGGIMRSVDPGAVAASTIGQIVAACGLDAIAPVGLNVLQFGLPSPSVLLAGTIISTVTVNLQAGDQWGFPTMQVLEWLDI
jgi:hypothetical protein